ncbi:NRAMP-like transporter smf-3, partial [Teratosphaeriaceae sp. CCFEE 6253]
MNCPSKTDPDVPDDWNQSPDALNGDTTTRSDLSRIANARLQRDHRLRDQDDGEVEMVALQPQPQEQGTKPQLRTSGVKDNSDERAGGTRCAMLDGTMHVTAAPSSHDSALPFYVRWPRKLTRILMKYTKFIGPGFLISVAYIDPGNYATDVAAGATFRFKLLFMVLLSNLFAIFLQSLCIKLGTVTGLNLAEMCRAHMPP